MKVAWYVFCNTLLFLLIGSSRLFAQSKDLPPDTLRARLNNYSKKKPASVLFAHFDKTIYNNSETAWFTAYLLNQNKRTTNPATLTALLANEQSRSLVKSLKFELKNGVAYGSFDIPDSIAPGNYSFILYTNVLLNGQPQDIFTQHIIIKQTVKLIPANGTKPTETAKKLAIVQPVPVIKFYPEGGNLVNATPCVVGIEAKDQNGQPLKIKAFLYRDNRFADTIGTDANGLGRFRISPYEKSTYLVKLTGQPSNMVYRLPKILSSGPVIHVGNALANDSLQISLWDTHSGRYHIIIHNYQQVFYSFHTRLSAAVKNNTFSLKDVPKGLAIVTLLDSLNRPVAERVFFAHYNRQLKIDISTDKPLYGTRQKVTLKLKLNSPDSALVNGAVSVAVVQASRLQAVNANNIESYFYLKSNLANIASKDVFLSQGRAGKKLLENILLIKGWRRYKWQEMISSDRAAFSQTVLGEVKPVLNNPATDLLKPDHYFIGQDKQTRLLIDAYITAAKDQVSNINNLLIRKLEIKKYHERIKADLTDISLSAASPKKNTVLNTVHIQSSRLYNYIANNCGDYVCRFNVLNCPAHKYESDNTLPKVKDRYTVNDSSVLNERMTVRSAFRDDKGKRMFIVSYNGCANLKPDLDLTSDDIMSYKEFYNSDYNQIDPSQPDYLSTIYWKHACTVNSKNETELSFFTSDAAGPFKIIVQGTTANDAIYGEGAFSVQSP